MKKKIIVGICIALLLFCMSTGVASAKPIIVWQKDLSGPNKCYHVNFIKETLDGNYFIGGYEWYSPGLGKDRALILKIAPNGDSARGGPDVYKIHTNINSVYQLSKDHIFSDSSILTGNYIIVGNKDNKGIIMRSSGALDRVWSKTFDYISTHDMPSIQTKDNKFILASHSKDRIRLIKIDKTGDIEWDKYIKGGAHANIIISASDGGYILAGSIRTGEKMKVTSSGGVKEDGWDTYLIKIDSEGNIIWDKSINAGQCDSAISIKQTADNGFFIAGKCFKGPYKEDMPFLMKTNAKRNKEWIKKGNGGKIVKISSDGGCILIDGDLYKIDQNGIVVWNVKSVGCVAIRTPDGGFLAVDNDLILKRLEEPNIHIELIETKNSLNQRISGTVYNYDDSFINIRVNGKLKQINLDNGNFDTEIKLKEGKNKIEFVIDEKVYKTINISAVKIEIPKETYSFTNSDFTEEYALTYDQFNNLLRSYLVGVSAIKANIIAPFVFVSTEKGNCYGMSSTTILYHDGMKKPVDKDVYEMNMDDSASNIHAFQVGQTDHLLSYYVNYLLEPEEKMSYDYIVESIEIYHKPVVLTTWLKVHGGLEALYDALTGKYQSHAVVAYKAYEIDGEKHVVVYENKGKYPSVEDCTDYAIFDFSKKNAFSYLEKQNVAENVREVPYSFYPTVGQNTAINIIVDNFLRELIKLLHSNRLKLISVSCPVNVSITDESGRVIADNGTNQIPNAKVIATDDVKLFFIPDDLTYSVNIDAYGEGNFTLTQFSPIDDKRANATEFNSSVTPKTKASILISPEEVSEMKIDYNGNGTTDEEKEPVKGIIEVAPEKPTGEKPGISGFVAIIAIAGLLVVVYLLRRRG